MKLTYSQLEGVWIQNGGAVMLAPLMAAIALAESGGNSDSVNGTDNGGKQSSYGLWQISTGTHTAPAKNWSDPNVNAALAVGKYKSQGLKAWGTYTSGAYKPFLRSGVPASNVTSSGPLGSDNTTVTATPVANTVDATCAWHVHFPVAGDSCILSKVQVRAGYGILVGVTGIVVALVGLIILVSYGTGKNLGLIKKVTP